MGEVGGRGMIEGSLLLLTVRAWDFVGGRVLKGAWSQIESRQGKLCRPERSG